jgi:hypothetical protein
MIASLFNITFITESCAFIAAIWFLRKRATLWQLFIPLLFLTIFVETLGWWLVVVERKSSNSIIYNLLMIVTDLFSLWILFHAEPLLKKRKMFLWLMTAFSIFAIVNLASFQGPWQYNGYTELLGDLLQVVLCCYFFYSLLREERHRDLVHYEYFWLANGFLFSSLGSAVLYIFIDPLTAFYRQTGVNVYANINYLLNTLLYGSLILAFICRYRNTK